MKEYLKVKTSLEPNLQIEGSSNQKIWGKKLLQKGRINNYCLLFFSKNQSGENYLLALYYLELIYILWNVRMHLFVRELDSFTRDLFLMVSQSLKLSIIFLSRILNQYL